MPCHPCLPPHCHPVQAWSTNAYIAIMVIFNGVPMLEELIVLGFINKYNFILY